MDSHETLRADRALLAELPPVRVAVIGDVMLDRFAYGSVDRISPEAPIPILRITDERLMPGAAGNVAANLQAIGAHIDLIGVVGDDDAGRRLQELLGAFVDGHLPVEERGRKTTVKTRFIAGTQQLLRADDERITPPSAERIIRTARAAIDTADAVILSDYGKGLLTGEIVAAAIEAAAERGIPVAVDPKGRGYARYRGASVVTPNQKELSEEAGQPTDDDAQSAAAARQVLSTSGIGAMVATRGARGMTVLTAAQDEPIFLRGRPVEVFDVSGAGDTVVAVLAAALGAGADLVQAARLANLAGGLVVAKPGTATASRAELLAALDDALVDAPRRPPPLTDPQEAVRAAESRVAAWRARGLTVGFTNGCFDLLHPGHVRLLQDARDQCDRLVVGLNTDASVARLKGPERPVQDLQARATVLAGLAAVDLVVPFAEETPLQLITRLRPDVLVKGSDYAPEQVVGAAEVASWGGRLHLVDLVADQSTSALIARSRTGR